MASPGRFIERMRRFAAERSGSIAIMTALMFPLIVGSTLFGIDHMRAGQQVYAMQRAADAAALASVQQLAFVLIDNQQSTPSENGEHNETLSAIAANFVDATLKNDYLDLVTTAKIIGEDQVVVSITARYGSLFGEIGAFGENPFTVQATAQSFGGQNVCFIALGDNKEKGISLANSAQLVGGDCKIYSNSERTDSISATGSAQIDAPFICSAGGYSGSANNFATTPTTDCPKIEDPLKSRTPPPFDDTCDHTALTLDGGTHTLNPGTYCGKTDLRGGADVWLNEGVYVFKDGELHVHDTSKLAGTGVGLYFDDEKSFFKFLDYGYIDLSAPVTGPMAGILMASRNLCGNSASASASGNVASTAVSVTVGNGKCSSGRKFSITSSRVNSLIGTIHLPTDEVIVDTTMPVSGEAAFTIIVVGSIELKQSPTLVLNSDYDATNVPVPPGFRGESGGSPRLVQ